MEKYSLTALLDEDREQVLANLAGDRALPAAQAALEKAIDRVMYRYVEGCADASLADCAQRLLQSMKNTLPVMDAVGEARIWKKQVETGRRGRLAMKPAALALMLAGALLVLASVLAVLIGSGAGGLLAFLKALLPVTLGSAALFLAGAQSAQPKREKASREGDLPVRTEYLVDAEKAWHCLRGAMLQADGQLERVREENALRLQAEQAPQVGMSPEALNLFAELLELAYAASDENAREAAANMKFYLHNAQIEIVDYAEGRESWFEFLPANRPGTLRPALVSGGRLLRKGLACAR